MDGFVTGGLVNGGLAALLACVAFLATKAWRNPYFARIAWLAVLLKFVTPQLLFVPVVAPWLQPSGEELPGGWHVVAERRHAEAAIDSQIEFSMLTPRGESMPPAATLADAGIAPAAPPLDSESPAWGQRWADVAAQLDWSRMLRPFGYAWLVGSGVLGCLALLRICRFHRLLSRCAPAPAALLVRAEKLAAQLGLRATPQVRVVSGRIAPLAWGFGRQSTIVVPAALVEALDGEAIDAILAHEMTHLQRRDGWARWLELVAVVAYWWCPVAWFARRRVHDAEEQCCDADALRLFPALRRGYGRALMGTLDLLANDLRLAPGATGWGSRGSLRRRCELIARRSTATPLRGAVRRGCWAMMAILCISAPMADSSEPPTAEPAAPPTSSEEGAKSDDQTKASLPGPAAAMPDESTPCTITLEDGSVINGMLIDQAGERLVVLREPKSAKEATLDSRLNPPVGRLQADWKMWDLTLKECIRLTFANHRGSQVVAQAGDEDRLTISPVTGFWRSPDEFRAFAADQLRDIVECYAELHFAYGDLESRRVAEANSLQTWRGVKAKFDVGAVGGEEAAETQTRRQYFNCRSQMETAQKNLFTVENRLRYLLGLAANDGRLIRPSTPLEADERRYDWETVHAEALANRTELRDQRELLEKHRQASTKLNAEAAKVTSERPTVAERVKKTEARHAELLVSREAAELTDMELSVSHQLGQAVRDVDLTYGTTQTNFNQRAAAEDDLKAVRAIYDAGRASIDLLLQAIQRRAEAESAYHRALVDYERAKMRVEYRKETVLEAYGISVAE